MLVDVHAHLFSDAFAEDLDQVLARAKRAGVVAIVNNSLDEATAHQTLDLAKRFPILKAALGLYPLEALKLSTEDVDRFLAFILRQKRSIVAIGEVGMDLNTVQREEEQRRIFERFIELARKMKKPLIVHSRRAEVQTLEALEQLHATNVIMHCFSGSLNLARRIEHNGWYLSIPPNVAVSTHFQRIVEEVAIDRILTETDAPYLAPERGQRNEPAFIARTIKKIAEIKRLDGEEVKKIIFKNYQTLFRE